MELNAFNSKGERAKREDEREYLRKRRKAEDLHKRLNKNKHKQRGVMNCVIS